MPRYEVAAYYFPNYHPDPRNDRWHGTGWTEWELVKNARPRYPGHQQPKVPAWGYFNEADPAWAAKEIDLAADHGITAFLYDWYWYEDGPYLQHQLEEGFLKAPNNQRLKFALMWANHDWTNIHPTTFVNRPEVLSKGIVSRAAWERLTDHVVAHYFSRPNYLTVDGHPYFSIYELGTFIQGLGGVQGAADAIASFRAKTKAAGFADLHLNAVVYGVKVLPSETRLADRNAVINHLGFASLTTYAWVHHYNPNDGGFPRSSYAAAAEANLGEWQKYRKEFSLPYHPNVSMGWDSSPRTIQSDKFEPRGYPYTAILEGNTPAAFHAALLKAKAFLDSAPHAHKMLTLNAWNEWTEGSYLLPDTRTGLQYLQAVNAVFG